MKKELNEFQFNDMSARHTRINPTGKATKYWIAVDEYSSRLSNYSSYVNQSLQLIPIKNNNTPPSTTDKKKIWELANRAAAKYPKFFIFIGQDKSSHGTMTGKDHLRASVLTYFDPNAQMWSDIPFDMLENEKEIQESVSKFNSNDIARYAKLYNESLTEKELSESTSDEDIINTAFSTMLYFLCGEGDKVLKDDEWVNYLINDINTAIQKGMFKPSFEDKQHIKQLQDIRVGESDIEAENE